MGGRRAGDFILDASLAEGVCQSRHQGHLGANGHQVYLPLSTPVHHLQSPMYHSLGTSQAGRGDGRSNALVSNKGPQVFVESTTPWHLNSFLSP